MTKLLVPSSRKAAYTLHKYSDAEDREGDEAIEIAVRLNSVLPINLLHSRIIFGVSPFPSTRSDAYLLPFYTFTKYTETMEDVDGDEHTWDEPLADITYRVCHTEYYL